jgi:hypothetical protein
VNNPEQAASKHARCRMSMALTDKLPSMAGHCPADSQHGAPLCVPARHQQRHAKGSAHAALSRVILSESQRQVTQGLEGWQG